MINNNAKIPILYASIANAATEVNNKSHQHYGNIWRAYLIMDEVLSSLVNQGSEDPSEVSESASKRICITTGLLQSSTIIEKIISSGFYWAACAILRQHMEAIARLIHIRNGASSKEKSAANVNVLPFGLQKNYGRFSELCHLSNGELFGDFARSLESDELADILPKYNSDWHRDLLGIHIEHLIVLAIEISILHMELYPHKPLIDIESPIIKAKKLLISESRWKNRIQKASIGSDAAYEFC